MALGKASQLTRWKTNIALDPTTMAFASELCLNRDDRPAGI